MSTYPTKEQFEEVLRTRSIDRILEDYLFSGLPFFLADSPALHRRMVGAISRGLRVPGEDICVVGSARIGFSLSPENFGTPFNRYSDVDIVVVSQSLFDSSWLDILTSRRASFSLLRPRTRHYLREHRERHHIYNGWIRPDSVAEALEMGERWLTTFNALSGIPDLASRSIGGRLYRTWEHARAYHRWSLEKVQLRIVGRPHTRRGEQ